MSDSPIRVGILGLGRSGWDIHAAALSGHPDFAVAAVADPMAERREEARQHFGCATYAHPEEALADPAVDLIVVATPSHTHAALAIAALEAGKHAVVEKPMAQNLAEMDALLAAERTGRVLTCYQPRRLDAEFVAIQEIIASRRLGRLVLIHRSLYRFARRADWQMLRKFGGGELANNGAHLLDQVLVLLDGAEPAQFFADLQHTVGAGDAEDHVKVCFTTAAGTTAEVEVSQCAALSQPDWLILGTAGAVRGAGGELTVRWLDPATLGPLTLDEGPAAGRRYGTGEQITWQEETLRPPQARPQSLLFYDRLAATLRHGAPLLVTPRSIRPQIEIIERAHALAAAG
jgi:predicted dehydrogenase